MARERCSRAASLFLTALVGTLACGEYPDGTTDQAEQPITGGSVVTSNTAPYNSVIEWRPVNFGSCSGAKIGPRSFLTAAHCVKDFYLGLSMELLNNLEGVYPPQRFTIISVDRHPSFDSPAAIDHFASAFDIAVFTISGDTPAIPALPILPPFVGDGTRFVITGYGCDDTTPSHGGKKQVGQLTATFVPDPDLGVHNFRSPGPPTLCSGDSGGPVLILWQGAWHIAGVNSFIDDVGSRFARTGSVRRWIAAPAKNVYADGQEGSFLNGGSGKCIGIDGASFQNGAQAMQFYCDSRNQPGDNQSWLLRSNGSGFFRLVNRNSARCLGVDRASVADFALLKQFDCATPELHNNQSWRVVRTSGDYFQVVNGKSNKCIAVEGGSMGNAARLMQVGCPPLGSTNTTSWLFTR